MLDIKVESADILGDVIVAKLFGITFTSFWKSLKVVLLVVASLITDGFSAVQC